MTVSSHPVEGSVTVNRDTGEVVTYADVRESVSTARTHLEKAAEQVVWQVQNRVWTILGYESWDVMREAEYGGAAVIVPRADRPELVARLRSQGLSQQQIGDTLGVSERAVGRDLNRQTPDEVTTESRTDSAGRVRPVSYQRREPDPGPAVAEAVVEFPELAHYADTGRTERVLTLAAALRGYDEPELAMRRDVLRKAVAADLRRRDEPTAAQEPDPREPASDIFTAANTAAQTIARRGGPAAIEAALAHAEPLEVENWRRQFADLSNTCRALADACAPKLRRIK